MSTRFHAAIPLVLATLLSACIADLQTTPSSPAVAAQHPSSASRATSSSTVQLIQPVTGGPPVIAVSVGGGVYVPVSGRSGRPVVGIPLSH